MTPLLAQVKKLGGISPDLSGLPEVYELGRDFRAMGFRGVIWSNGRGRGADEMFSDLDIDLQELCLGVATTNHPLIDGLAYELCRLQAHRDRYGRVDLTTLPEHVQEYIQGLETAVMDLRARIEELSPETGTLPDVTEFSGSCIRQARECLGITQAQAAVRLGASVPTLNRWENGKSHPVSPSHIRGLASMVGDAMDSGMELVSTPF